MDIRGTIEAILLGNFILFALVFMISVPILVLLYAGYWKLFKKCGEEGWQAIIPIYNTYVLTQITGNYWWWFLIASSATIISFTLLKGYVYNFILLSIFGRFVINYNLSKKFHKDLAYTILMTLFPLIMYAVLGYGTDKYDSEEYVSPNGPFDYNKEPEKKAKKDKETVPLYAFEKAEEEEVKPKEAESIYTYEETTEEAAPVKKTTRKTTTKKTTTKKATTKKVTAKTTAKKTVKKATKKPIKRSYKKKLEAEAKLKETTKKPVKKTAKKATVKKTTTKRKVTKKK